MAPNRAQLYPDLLDIANDPVPPYEEFQAGSSSSWELIDSDLPERESGNLIDLEEAEEESPGSSQLQEDVDEPGNHLLTETDTVIAVMGVTGAGKSRFISQLTNEEVEIGNSLESCTTDPGMYDYKHQGKVIRLIDTPGFDDTNRKDTDILQDIAFFFTALYAKKIKLAGILYLHRITDPRMTGTAVKNLQLLQKLCGDEGLKKVILVSTMWNLLTETAHGGSPDGYEIGEKREEELRKLFWNDLIKKGSRAERHYGDKESGDRILDAILSSDSGPTQVVLDIQREIHDKNLQLLDTAAGQFLQKDLNQARGKFERDLLQYQKELEEAKAAKDQEQVRELEIQKREIEEQLRTCNAKTSELQVDFQSMAKKQALGKNNDSTTSDGNDLLQKRHTAEIELIEKNLMNLEYEVERKERKHKAEINRLKNKQQKEKVDATELIAQQKLIYESQYRELQRRILAERQARLDKERELKIYRQKEKQKEASGGFIKFFGLDTVLGLFRGESRVRGQRGFVWDDDSGEKQDHSREMRVIRGVARDDPWERYYH